MLTPHQEANTSPTATEKKVLYWFDPMKPDVHFDKPGQSPFMDMAWYPNMQAIPLNHLG
ncbi:heavy metal-binding domain-containing protein [Chitinibacter mangrovi]|uniref:heavy metal-binding domain-containing protein n=1 Tax=Chitinibacter mangrovi TaxID=3153927 RepID=UPI003D816570